MIQAIGIEDTLVWLGILLGIAMPLVSAAVYPTYVHEMPQRWVEWTRLLELPFVACEMAVLHVALRKGYRDRDIWEPLPRDVKIAAGLLAIGAAVSSVLVSKNPAASVAISIFTLVHLRFAAAVYFLVRRDGMRGLDKFVPLLGAGLITLALATAWKLTFLPPPSEIPGGKVELPAALPGFINVRHFGSWTAAMACGLLGMLLYAPRRNPAILALYTFGVGMTAWSGTRAGMVAIIVVGAAMVAGTRTLPRLGTLALITALSAIATLLGVMLVPDHTDFWLFQYSDMEGTGAFTGGRLDMWIATFNKWLEAPIFGWGSGSMFWEVRSLGWTHTQPHNVVLQFLISWGVIGAVGGLWLIGRALRAAHVHAMGEPRLLPVAGVLYALLFQSLLEGMLHYPRFIMTIMTGFAVILAHRALQLKSRAGD